MSAGVVNALLRESQEDIDEKRALVWKARTRLFELNKKRFNKTILSLDRVYSWLSFQRVPRRDVSKAEAYQEGVTMDLKGKTLKELRAIAKEMGITGVLGKNAADLARMISKADKGNKGKGTAADPKVKGSKKAIKSKAKEEEEEEEEEDDDEEEEEEEDEKPKKSKAKDDDDEDEEEEDEDDDEDDEDEDDEDEDDDDDDEEEDDAGLGLSEDAIAEMNRGQLLKVVKKIHASANLMKRAGKARIDIKTKVKDADDEDRTLAKRVIDFLKEYGEPVEDGEVSAKEFADLTSRVAMIEKIIKGLKEGGEEEEDEKPKSKKESKAAKDDDDEDDDDEEEEEDEDDEDDEEESSAPEHIRIGAKVEVQVDEGKKKVWMRGVVDSVDEDGETADLTLDTGDEVPDAAWDEIRAASKKPKTRK